MDWSSILLRVILLLLCYVLANIFILLVDYMRKCRALKKLPQLPAHWLHGHAREVNEDTPKSFLNFFMRSMEDTKAKCFVLWMGPFPFIHICHPDAFKQVAQTVLDKDISMTGALRLVHDFVGEGLLSSNGLKWERNRKLLTPAFHFQILSGYISVMNEEAQTLLDQLDTAVVSGQSVDVFPYVCRSALDVLVRCSLSYKGNFQLKQNSYYIKAVQRILEITTRRYAKPWKLIDCLFYMSSEGREMRKLSKIARNFTENIISARRKEVTSYSDLKEKRRLDFLDILLTARDEKGKGLSHEEIHDEVDTFTFAGHDTTATTISWTIYALAMHPEYQTKVYDDVCEVLGDDEDINTEHLGKFTYLTYFVKETMRYYSPVPIITRRNRDPIEIDGYEIPSGCSIHVQFYLIHHNKHVWQDHDVFNPERFDNYHRDDNEVFGFLPFSAGSRNCIGQVFAMNEVKITIAKLVKRFEIVKDPDNETDIRPEFVMRPTNGINVFLKRRQTNVPNSQKSC